MDKTFHAGSVRVYVGRKEVVVATSGQFDTGMELRDLLTDDEFLHRRTESHRADRGFEALNRLAQVFAEDPAVVLQKLVDIAVEFCGADSAGISLEETDDKGEQRFRWIVISGSFSRYLNGTTPRNFSPCGTCLDSGRPQHYRVTQPYYDFLGVTADEISDGILIPWDSGANRGTIWAVAHRSREAFDLDDYKLLTILANFASIAVRRQRQQETLRQRDRDLAAAAMAHELAHQINNPLQSLMNILYLISRDGKSPLIAEAAGQLEALSALVKQILALHETALQIDSKAA